MKKQITVTVAGEAGTGKSTVTDLIQQTFRRLGIEVKNYSKGHRSEGSVNKLAMNSIVTIRTRTIPEIKMLESSPADDGSLLVAIRTARDKADDFKFPAGPKSQALGEMLAILGAVADELEDRLAKQQERMVAAKEADDA